MPLPVDLGGDTVGYSFAVEIAGVSISAVTEVSALTLDRDVIEVKELAPDGTYVIKRLPGRWKGGEVTLTRGLTGDGGFQQLVQGTLATGTGAVISVFDSAGAVLHRYVLLNAWPKSLQIGPLKGGDTDVPTERLVLAYEQLQVE